jgi:hypothetical protein
MYDVAVLRRSARSRWADSREANMKLTELAFACFVYSNMSDYDSSYREFLKATRPRVDLGIEHHRLALLNWLNDWGCRQFAIEYHDMASGELRDWNKAHNDHLSSINKSLISLTSEDTKKIKDIYTELASKKASKRELKGKMATVEFGPTGAAKILFALKPNTFIPWDQPIRTKFELDGTADSYCDYMLKVRDQLKELSKDCERNGFSLHDLPRILNREGSSIAKLIDEYYWVTITKGSEAPRKKDLQLWLSWM